MLTFRNFTQTINIETFKKETYIYNLCFFNYKVYWNEFLCPENILTKETVEVVE